MGLNGWHIGERAIRKRLHLNDVPFTHTLYSHISPGMPPEHYEFHTTKLPFLPITTLDEKGRPWGSILAGKDGEPGFISGAYPPSHTLDINAKVWDGDPLLDTALLFERDEMLVAGIGIEFATRRRNKLAGRITNLVRDGTDFTLRLFVNEALGNCPKYINLRQFSPYPETSPKVAFKVLDMASSERLPDELIKFIVASDTVFLGTTYHAPDSEAQQFPSHLGMNQRGGRRGFIRVLPSDGRSIILPDFSGNRFMTSLGNIEATPFASLTFVDFEKGDILYITGDARNLLDAEARRVMVRQNAITMVYTTGYRFVRDALPLRQRTAPEASPYSPPIHFLVEEASSTTLFDDSDKVTLLLRRIVIHSQSVATFTWETSRDLEIKPGQAAVLDLSTLLGSVSYQHMAPGNPTSVNDDRIRTWTVSSFQSPASRTFEMTIRHKPGGAVTTVLFSIAHRLAQLRPEALVDSRPLDLRLDLAGISGDFILPSSPTKLLWIAGGIGITPFLSMLKAISSGEEGDQWDVEMVLATREPDLLLALLSDAIKGEHVRLTLHVFSDAPIPDIQGMDTLHRHSGRVQPSFFSTKELDPKDRLVYLCGPEPFEKMAIDALVGNYGLDPNAIKREGFQY
ncbi:hypothetical protein C8J56DRAFT_779465 [Mycena floridula]|nr:hypothetical protein C8J56DRAFT_779465 [Mycena floridula]